MAHSYQSGGVSFTYNSDFSGAVEITAGVETIKVPGEALVNFVAHCYVRPRKIAAVEDATTDEILGLREKGGAG